MSEIVTIVDVIDHVRGYFIQTDKAVEYVEHAKSEHLYNPDGLSVDLELMKTIGANLDRIKKIEKHLEELISFHEALRDMEAAGMAVEYGKSMA